MKFIKREVLKQKPDFSNLVFGKNISDYTLECDYADGKWGEPVIKPVEDFALSPATMIFHYGQGIFEGCKCFKNEKGEITLFRIRDNLNRMNRSAERMSMPKIDVEEMLKGLKELIKIEKDWIPDKEGQSLYIRPTMIATESSIGVKTCGNFKFYIILSPAAAYLTGINSLVKIKVEDKYVRACVGGTGEAKCIGNYAGSFLAMNIAKSEGYAQVLWLDSIERKYIEEVGTMNVMFVINGEVLTPALSGSILPGITRDSAIKLLRDEGYTVTEKRITVDEVMKAAKDGSLTEMFGVGTAAIVSPVGTLGYKGEDVVINGNKVGEVSKLLYEKMMGIQRGRIADKFGWVEKVD